MLTQTALSLGVPCESIEDISYGWAGVTSAKSCIMKSISYNFAREFLITSPADSSVEGFTSYTNKNIRFLPENPAEKFPNLIIMWAQDCSIEKISKKNFQDLNKLRGLALSSNLIEKITSDTFEDLVSLTHLYLGELYYFQ